MIQIQMFKCAKYCQNLSLLSLTWRRGLSSNVNIFVLSDGSCHSSKSLFIVAEGKRYLFNCGEGTQKMFFENGQKISLLKNIFFTRSSQQNLNGLIGLALSIDNNSVNHLCLHGAAKSMDIVKASKKLMGEDNCKIVFNAKCQFEDSVFNVTSFRYGNKTIDGEDECIGYAFTTKQSSNFTKSENLRLPKRMFKSKLISQSQQNSQITLTDDKIINSKDDFIKPKLNNTFLVIECPTIDHIASMTEALPLKALYNDTVCFKFIFHLTDKIIFQHESYQKFIQSINNKCMTNTPPKHIVIDSTLRFPLSYSSFYVQTCLNYFFDHQMFPKLKLYESYIKQSNKEKCYVENDNVMFAEPFMQFTIGNFKSKPTEAWSKLKYLNENDIIDEILNKNAFFPPEVIKEKMDYLKKELTVVKELLGDDECSTYPNVTFLGTSATSPSKYRNVTSLLIAAKPSDFVMFDCGEGTVDRIIMLHGLKEANDIIRNITLICISHHHLDHHLGLYTLLRYRELLGNCKPCLLLTARNVRKLLTNLDTLFNTKHCSYNCDWCLIDLLPLDNNMNAADYSFKALDNYQKEHGLKIKPVRVFHTSTSYGFVLAGDQTAFKKSWKITYSGDCSPKFEGLRREGLDSDILIHEATMDDGLEDLAAFKRHSTVNQAIQEGVKMNAKFTVLTHFSSRYPLVPPLEYDYHNVVQAFDFMIINLKSCAYLKVLDSYLEYLFPKHYNRLLNERQKNLRKNEDKISNIL